MSSAHQLVVLDCLREQWYAVLTPGLGRRSRTDARHDSRRASSTSAALGWVGRLRRGAKAHVQIRAGPPVVCPPVYLHMRVSGESVRSSDRPADREAALVAARRRTKRVPTTVGARPRAVRADQVRGWASPSLEDVADGGCSEGIVVDALTDTVDPQARQTAGACAFSAAERQDSATAGLVASSEASGIRRARPWW
ncbi:uncharacterized protein PSFLO_06791 [Pseudozyma flocculosa]|uniref:Uncharacterized protein n=1 Tax=Pseudozyma flocculosa TaxID=84751 RepID=A0A5C3FD77_9BASI|nr:uncharacterized protein PSFLO_06791 [Pseudozyma flocculosa]